MGVKDLLVTRSKNAKILLIRYACKGLDIVPDMEKHSLNACHPVSVVFILSNTSHFIWRYKEMDLIYLGSPGGSVVKNLPASEGDAGVMGSVPGLGRSLE